ncbi:MAG: FUSC family protein [Actinomycetota bacterium]
MDATASHPGVFGMEGRRARRLGLYLAGPGPGRPAPLAALRMAIALAAPLAVGIAVGRPDLAVLAALGAVFTSVVEPGGGYGRHLRVYGLMTVLNALVVMLALACSGHAVAAGVAMLLLGVAAGVSTAWGAIPTLVAPTCLVLFIVAQAFTPAPAFGWSVLAVAVGTAWVALIAVIPWPVAPYAPAELATGRAWMAVADYAGAPADDRLQQSALEAIVQARDTVASVRSRRPGWSATSARLWATLVAASRVVSLVSSLEDERRREQADPAVRAAMDDVLSKVQSAARDIAVGTIDRTHVHPAQALEQSVGRLKSLTPDPAGLTGAALHTALVDRARVRAALRINRRIGDAIDALELPDPPQITITRPRRPAKGVSLRAALDPRCTAMRHGLRLGIATGLSVGVFTALAGTPVIGITHGQWVSIALVGVLQPTLGDSVQIAAQRALGTALGAVVAMVLLAIAQGCPYAMAAAILVVGALAALLQPVNYLWFITLFTPLSLLLSAVGAGLDAAIASERIIATGVACVIGLAIAAFAWPTRSGEQLPAVLGASIDTSADDLGAVLRVAAGDLPRTAMSEVHQRAMLGVDDAARVLQARMGESIEAFSRPDALAELEATAMQLVRDIGTLAGRIPIDGVAIPGAAEVRAQLTGALREVATAVRAGTSPPALGDLPDCLAEAHAAVDDARTAEDIPRGLAGTVDMLDTIAFATQRLAREAGEWAAASAQPRLHWWQRLAPAAGAPA